MTDEQAREEDFVAFLRRNHRDLSRAAHHHATWADPAVCGDDVHARAVARAWERWPDTDPSWDDDRRRAWMITIMVFVAREDLRAAARRRRALGVLAGLESGRQAATTGDPTARAVEAREVLRRLLPDALESLAPQDRWLWQLRRTGLVSDESIAEEVGIAVSSVRSRCARITATLRDRVGLDDPPHRRTPGGVPS